MRWFFLFISTELTSHFLLPLQGVIVIDSYISHGVASLAMRSITSASSRRSLLTPFRGAASE